MAEKVKKKLSTRQKTMIVMAAVLIVAVIAVAVALIVVSGLNVSHKETDGFVYSLSGGQATVLEYTGEEQEVTVYWDVEEYLPSGTYHIYLFADGNMIGEGSFSMK